MNHSYDKIEAQLRRETDDAQLELSSIVAVRYSVPILVGQRKGYVCT